MVHKMSAEEREGISLGDAVSWLRGNLREGAVCPCCRQVAKVYKRSLNANMSRLLISAYRQMSTEWFHAPSLKMSHDGTGDLAKLRYWNLVEEGTERRNDGGRAGWWRVTDLGRAYAEEAVRVPKYALIYNGSLLRLESPEISVRDSLGIKFSYEELMSA